MRFTFSKLLLITFSSISLSSTILKSFIYIISKYLGEIIDEAKHIKTENGSISLQAGQGNVTEVGLKRRTERFKHWSYIQ